MSNNIANTSTSTSAPIASLPMVEEINGWNQDGVKEFLQERRAELDLDLEGEDIDKIYNQKKLESLNDTEVVTTGEVNLEQLMVELVGGTEITEDRQVKFTDDIKNLNELYNAAVDVIDGTNDYSIHEKIKRIIRQAFGYIVLTLLKMANFLKYFYRPRYNGFQNNCAIIL
uniref:Uncharacterized protein n=1 Tax=Rhizophagus irregularis (strain DAOM 181602 / DAOM 197198 / MUCL 43194) TaxID=747089 RepID=U9U5B9_RHIID